MGRGLRREIEGMMKILSKDPWQLVLIKFGAKFRYQLIVYSSFAKIITVEGDGASKNEALENLLGKWRAGKTGLECPARSREELELKLALLGSK